MGNIQSTPPSTTTINKRYDVFLNFRGEDTRYGFTNNLYKALCDKQIETFIDDQLKKGDTIGPNLSKTISESKISVVIFSEDYASSTWCLRELVEIMKCKKMDNQTVMPVFYNVAPSDVRKQAGSFKDGFDKHEKQFYEKLDSTKQVDSANVSKQRDSSMDSFVKSEKEFHEELQKWREALKEACEVTGYDSSGMRTEAGLVEEIVGDIEKKLMSGVKWSPSDYTGLVGHEERIEQVMRLLCLYKTNDIRIIGIWGMGGIGKTTIADAIFKKISYQFQGTCFIKNVREKLEKNVGLESLQEEFLSKVLSNEGNLKLDGPTFSKQIKEMFKKRKVLIVLDDVDDFIKLKDLAGSLDQFGLGSRIMITSRDKQVLKNCTGNDHNIYEVKGFDYLEAHKLFCDFAFQNDHPTEDLNVLSTKIVNYAKGNPLALKVLGSSLFQMGKENWESAIANLQENFNGHIFNVLKVSYDGLNREERNLFLDIACFFQGNYEEEVANIYGKSISFLLSVLKGKSLITVSQFRIIEMHDLLQEMGREIVDNESDRVGKRSRLWRQDDVLRTLTNDDGTNKVQGIILHMDKMEEDIYLSPRAFEKMKSLKFLKLWSNPYYSSPYKVLCPDDLIYLSNELRYLCWSPYPLKVLPSNFKRNNLVQLDLSYSNIERLWEDIVVAPKLKWLILFKCQHLTSISNHLRAPLLEKIDLQYCIELLDFPSPNERGFKQLRELNLRDCTKLKQLPSMIHCESLESLILSGCSNLTRISDLSDASLLETLNLQGCESLPVFPRLAQNLQNLHMLDLIYLPNELMYLYWSRCPLKVLPSNFKRNNLVELDLRYSNIERLWEDTVDAPNLKWLILFMCQHLTSISNAYMPHCLRRWIFNIA